MDFDKQLDLVKSIALEEFELSEILEPGRNSFLSISKERIL
ncbi:hypothetical protein [Cytobacillus massiliigabonensis]|nr:hypothetical protein [Cytobacillus massiliigabonensis]